MASDRQRRWGCGAAMAWSIACLCGGGAVLGDPLPDVHVSRSESPEAQDMTGVALSGDHVKAASKLHPALVRRLGRTDADRVVKAWVLFTDKGIATDEEYRAAIRDVAAKYNRRAIQRRRNRRTRAGLFDEQDLPVAQAYLESVAATGVQMRVVSVWLNAVSVLGTRDQLERIAQLPEVRIVQPVRRGRKILPVKVEPVALESIQNNRTGSVAGGVSYGLSLAQLDQMNLIALHDQGFTGAGVVIGVLDTGFERSHDAFNEPTHTLDVIAEWDFVDGDPDTSIEPGDASGQHNHGTWILGTLGAYKPGELVGAAFDASFILCKTEDTTGEYPAEEDNYVGGLEFIEANGGDIATSSLGYIDWYIQADLDGMTAVTTLAVNTATANGLICLNAAGNGGHDADPTTSHLIAPADALQVLTCGAVTSTGTIASFSSDGPTADGRVKPELLARGVSTQTVSSSNPTAYSSVSGTSLSTPLLAGAVACILQAHPSWTVDSMRTQLFETASYYAVFGTFEPTYVLGYGIIDAAAASLPPDCNENGIDDAEDIASELSPDANSNGIPDECECPAPEPPATEQPHVKKIRYLSIVPGNPGLTTALRVTPASLLFPYNSLAGEHLWVGPPFEITENSGRDRPEEAPGYPTAWIATLQCEPHYTDWSVYGTVHVTSNWILPSGTYDVQAVDVACRANLEVTFSSPLTLATSRWGDLVGNCETAPCSPPDGGIAITTDVTAVLNKFKNIEGAPIKARSDLDPATPDQRINISDVTFCLGAFRGEVYEMAAPEPCP